LVLAPSQAQSLGRGGRAASRRATQRVRRTSTASRTAVRRSLRSPHPGERARFSFSVPRAPPRRAAPRPPPPARRVARAARCGCDPRAVRGRWSPHPAAGVLL